jgi:hypothetical protein
LRRTEKQQSNYLWLAMPEGFHRGKEFAMLKKVRELVSKSEL